jgi:hypothetical protein
MVFAGPVSLVLEGALLLAICPVYKAELNKKDTRRYTALMARSHTLSDDELAVAFDEANRDDCPEIEPLRDVAYNDVALEFGCDDAVIPLTPLQKILAALA